MANAVWQASTATMGIMYTSTGNNTAEVQVLEDGIII